MSKRSYGNAGLTRVYAAGTFKAPRRATYASTGGSATFVPRAGYSSVARTRGASVQGEMKYFDTEVAGGAIPSIAAWTGTEFDPTTFNTLCVPTVGAAINQRIGKAIKVMKIKINGIITVAAQSDAAAADGGSKVRLILYQDKQTNAAQAQGEQVMTPSTAAANAPNVFQNIDNFGRFVVLKDKTIIMENPNLTYDGTNVEQNGILKPFKFTVKFKTPVQVRFNATNGGSVADIVDNSFHVIANCSSTGLLPNINYVCRVCYKE